MKKVIYLSLILMTISCSSTITKVIDDATVASLSAVVTGTLSGSPKLEYRNASGTLKSEVLTVGNWNKTFKINKGFKLFIKATGNIDGNIKLNASAINSDSSTNFEDSRSITITPVSSFDVQISTTTL